jgi:sugar phosphate isomerase/epimerase
LALWDLPAFTRNELGLHGLTMSTTLLAGLDRAGLQKFVDAADRAGCPCLALIETDPQPLFDENRAQAAADRTLRVVQAASWLGCSAAGVPIECPDDDEALQDTADNLRPLVRKAERMELNLCITSGTGLSANPERITELLKRIGGFRVGTVPDFLSASQAADPAAYLRRLVPYASTVLATAQEISGSGKKLKHEAYDLLAYLKVLASVGYDGALAIDYRGPGDVAEGITRTRDLLRTVLGGDPEDDLEDLV